MNFRGVKIRGKIGPNAQTFDSRLVRVLDEGKAPNCPDWREWIRGVRSVCEDMWMLVLPRERSSWDTARITWASPY